MAFDKSEWRPNPKQEDFLALPFIIKEGFFGGGAGSGKTDLLLIYGIAHDLHLNPLFKQVFMRRTRPDMKKEIVGRTRELYTKFGATYNGTDMIWTFPRPDQFGGRGMGNSGAQIFLAHCEEEKDVHNFDSMEISLFTPDELTNDTEFIYLYIGFERGRAPQGSGLPSIIRAAGMPGGIGHSWVKKRFVDPYKHGGKIITGRGGNKRIYIHATLEDNKEHIDPSYAQSLDARPDAERKAKKFGDWSAYLGQVFDEFRDKKYPDEPDNALHVVAPFEIPKWWPKFVIGDWGFAAMTYIMFIAISPSKRVYVYRELHWTKTKIAVWGELLRLYIETENIRLVKFCQSSKQDRGQEHTIQQQIEAAIGRSIELSGNVAGSRVAGKMQLHEYLRWKQIPRPPLGELPPYSDEHARWLLRNKGIEDYKTYLGLFEPAVEETNIPRLQIFCCDPDEPSHEGHENCCPVLINAIKACSYDKPKDNKPAEDVAEFEGDDPYDTLRYAVDSAEAFFGTANEEFVRVQKEADLIAKLSADKDWTAFYRQMRSVEAEEQQGMVRRFHRAKR